MWRLGGGRGGIWGTGGGGNICGGKSGDGKGGMFGNSGGGWRRKGLGGGGKLFGSERGRKSEEMEGTLDFCVEEVGTFSVESDSFEFDCIRKGIPAEKNKNIKNKGKKKKKWYWNPYCFKADNYLTFIGNFLKHTDVLKSGKSTS